MQLTVSDIARLAGVTVRTLHHYDALGLVTPAGRSAGGYRLYGHADLERLQSVLFYRELGFSLGEITRLMAMPGFSRREALVDQHALLAGKKERIERMLKAVEAALAAEEQGVAMSEEELMSPFGDFDPTEYRAEAEERWGGTDAYRESIRRTQAYSDNDWAEVLNEAEGIAKAFVNQLRQGSAAHSTEAKAVAERHRRHIHERFYPCSHEMHNNLGEMYVADPRFTAYWDKYESGLAAFVRDAIAANTIDNA